MSVGRRGRIVTWSPVVVGVHRPSRKKTRAKTLRSSVVLFNGRRIEGTLDGHFRGDTHSLLLTMREKGHRTLQMLIDLPEKRLKRVYDGISTWNFQKNGKSCELHCAIGNVVWEDGEVRDVDSRGFRLDWLQGNHTMSVVEATKGKKKSKNRRPHNRSSTQRTHRTRTHRSRKTMRSSVERQH